MSELMDDIAYLSQEIGPRPAGTEEERQAAEFLVDRFANSAVLEAEIEDFSCASRPGLVTAVLFGLAGLFTILGALVGALAVLALIVCLAAAVLYVLELRGIFRVSGLFSRGASQNVVARFEPLGEPNPRRRKVVVVANYDSDHVRPELSSGFLGIYPTVQKACAVALVALPVLWLIRVIAGNLLPLTVLLIVAAVIALVPAVLYIIRVRGAYNEAANDNATGTAALIELARRLADDAWEGPDTDDAEAPEVYGAEAAEEAGVLPVGVPVSYEVEPNAVYGAEGEVYADDPAAWEDSPAAVPAPAADPAASGSFARTAAHAAPAPDPAADAQDAAPARSSRGSRTGRVVVSEHPIDDLLPEDSGPQAPVSAPDDAPAAAYAPGRRNEPSVPDWYVNAQRKANRSGQEAVPVRRSRYADALDAAVAESSKFFERANRVVEDEAAARQEARAAGIREVEPPTDSLLEQPQAAARPRGNAPAHSREPQIFEGSADAAFAAGAPAPEAAAPAPSTTGATMAIDPIDVAEFRSAAAAEVERAQGVEAPLPAEEAAFAPAPIPVLPQITLPEIEPDPDLLPSVDTLKQRAPLAEAAAAAPAEVSPLAAVIPPIEAPSHEPAAPVPGMIDNKRAALRASLPSMSGSINVIPPLPENSAVSLTGSFAAVGATGAFAPVGDELVADVAPEDMYVEDADDSSYEENTTPTGAYAGPGYMEMPKSRFSLFNRKKKQPARPEITPQEWLDVPQDFNPTEEGRARGGWESFRRDDNEDFETQQRVEAFAEEDDDWGQPFGGYTFSEYSEDDDEWNGGAYSRDLGEAAADDLDDATNGFDGEADDARPGRVRVSTPLSGGFADVAALAAQKLAAEAEAHPEERASIEALTLGAADEIEEFHRMGIDVEVWFVALGAEHAGNAGMRAFLANHASELRGAVVLNLEALGAGELSTLEEEGEIFTTKPASRAKRYLRQAEAATGRRLNSASASWRDSAASVAARAGLQALTLAGIDEAGKPAMLAQGDDVLEAVNPDVLADNIEFVHQIIKNV